jgi:hypothetical protein
MKTSQSFQPAKSTLCSVYNKHVTVLPTTKYQPTFMPASISSTLQYTLLQKNENNYNELFISILVQLFPVNLNINCY